MKLRDTSLKVKLGLGAGLIALVAIAASALMVYGIGRTERPLGAVLAAEKRIQHYSALAAQVGTFLVVAVEAGQSGLAATERQERLAPLAEATLQTFRLMRSDLETAVAAAGDLGLDQQSERASRSLGIARMEALFRSALARLSDPALDARQTPVRAVVDDFSQQFDQLLNVAVGEELRARSAVLADIAALRARLTGWALAMGAAAVLLIVTYHFGILRPQLRRLDQLRAASEGIGRQDFAVSLPEDSDDEIGRLFRQTNATAAALADRKSEVERQWARLNETIAEQTMELTEKNRRLAEIDADRRRFFADIGHELRTPLTVILMEAEIGKRGGSGPEAFEAIHKRALGLNRRMDDLLRIARSESGQLSLSEEDYDLCAAVAEAADETRAQVAHSGMTLETTLPAAMPVHGDPNWTRQVVAALIGNALRHAAGATAIRIVVDEAGAMARLRILDDGTGMAAEDQPDAFTRFAQGAGDRRREGFGIGLSLVKWVIERQGGQIDLQSPVPPERAFGQGPGVELTMLLPKQGD